MRVDLVARPARWRVELAASDGEWKGSLSDPVFRPIPWPWAEVRWRFVVQAAVVTFPPGRPFSVADLRRALPGRVRDGVGAGRISFHLGRLWREGMVVKVRKRQWAVPSHPDFWPEEWRAFLEGVRRERGEALGPGHQEALSTEYHIRLWEKRIRAAGTVKALEAVGRLIQEREPNPEVRRRLQAVYRERRQELKRWR